MLPDALNRDVDNGHPSLDLIVGVTSFGPTNCDGSKPGVYTNLGFFKDWIRDVIDDKPTDVEIYRFEFVRIANDSQIATGDEALPSLSSHPPPESESLSDFDVFDFVDFEFSSYSGARLLKVIIMFILHCKRYFLKEMEKAIEEDRDGDVRSILGAGLDPNSLASQSPSNDTLLHWAARYNASECTKVVSEYKTRTDLIYRLSLNSAQT